MLVSVSVLKVLSTKCANRKELLNIGNQPTNGVFLLTMFESIFSSKEIDNKK